jgi:hypothetical protein
MIVKTITQTFNAKQEPILLVFKDSAELSQVIEHLKKMDMEIKGERIYATFPDGYDREKIALMMEVDYFPITNT